VINTIKAFCADDATIIHGTVFDENMVDNLRVTVVATGIGKRASRPVLVPQTSLRTGTDNAPIADATGGYDRFDQPTVWRNPRASAAAQVQALEESGVERFDIPAFLRKQAD
jgi:cell division protein FtsZ